MKALALLVLALLQSSGGAPTERLSGRVIGVEGKPIAAVRVSVQGSGSGTSTDSDGRFTVALARFGVLGEWNTARFSHDGYRPVTKLLTTPDPVITLSKADDASWNVAGCTGKPQLQEFLMGLFVPKGAKVRSGGDFDYSIESVVFKKFGMELGFGVRWGSGEPFPSQLLEMRSISERDVIFEDQVRGVEYRGIRTNGTYFRFIGKAGESIKYDHVPKEAASYFDSILDTLCKVPR